MAKHMVKQMESAAKRQGNDRIGQILFDIQDYHASALDAAKIANQANVRKLVLTHLVPAPPNKIAEKIFMRGVSDIRQDSTMLAYDGLTLTLPLGSKDIQAANLFEY
jgi:ribonuclease Z